MEALSDLNTFAKILTDKGYNGNFHTQSAYAGKLKDSISEYLESCRKGIEDGPKPELFLTCYLQWANEDKPYVKCTMWVKYMDGKFDLQKMDIKKKDCFGNCLKQSELTNLSVVTAPRAVDAISMVNDTPKQKVVPNGNRFRF